MCSTQQKPFIQRCVFSDVLSCVLLLVISGGVPWEIGCEQPQVEQVKLVIL